MVKAQDPPTNIILSGTSVQLFYGWQNFIRGMFRGYFDDVIEAPLFISANILKQSKYSDHFPHQLFEVKGHLHQNRSSEQCITPAACLHVYPFFRDKDIKECSVLVSACCARYEKGQWRAPFRLPSFHMTELVVLGKEKELLKKLSSIEKLVASTLCDFGFQGVFQNATDVFFLGNNEGSKVIQKLKGLKKEFLVNLEGRNIALASLNNHEDFFARRFGITNGGVPVNSFCAAFGLERLAFYSLAVWGNNAKKWPKKFKEYGKIS